MNFGKIPIDNGKLHGIFFNMIRELFHTTKFWALLTSIYHAIHESGETPDILAEKYASCNLNNWPSEKCLSSSLYLEKHIWRRRHSTQNDKFIWWDYLKCSTIRKGQTVFLIIIFFTGFDCRTTATANPHGINTYISYNTKINASSYTVY